MESSFKYQQETTHEGTTLVVRGERIDSKMFPVKISISEKETKKQWGVPIPVPDCSNEQIIKLVDTVVKNIVLFKN